MNLSEQIQPYFNLYYRLVHTWSPAKEQLIGFLMGSNPDIREPVRGLGGPRQSP
jgi:hypothetical protein